MNDKIKIVAIGDSPLYNVLVKCLTEIIEKVSEADKDQLEKSGYFVATIHPEDIDHVYSLKLFRTELENYRIGYGKDLGSKEME